MRRIGFIIGILAVVLSAQAAELLSGEAIRGTGWNGLDLGQAYVITSVGYKPLPFKGSNNLLLGLFEGANRPDFLDALPIAIISETPQTGQMNQLEVVCSRGFRYVRYVAPDGAKNTFPTLEFYGEAGEGDDSQLSQLTNLPTVSIHTVDNQLPYDKEHEINCFISIISNDGHTLLCDSALIRERGNYSRGFPKKPYRIKFAHKHHVLGAPANAKKWTLINNYGDKTLMRNQLAFELSRRIGMPYTPFCAYVDVTLNGDYKGCYQLCDQIEVRKHRVDVKEMSPADNSGEALTGGYLIEADAYAYEEASMFWSDKGTGVTIKSPKEDSITWEQSEYIRKQYNRMESNWRNNLDLSTFLQHFLVGELSGNTDTYWSMYLYKQRGNDTLFVGPVWDFDLAFENDNRTYPINSLSDYIYRTKGSTTGYLKTLVDRIVVQNTDSREQLRNLWAETRKAGLTETSMMAYIDEQVQLLEQSQRLNFLRWPIMNEYVHQNPRIWGSYEAEVENVRSYLTKRIEWMDKKLQFDATTLDIESAPIDEPQAPSRLFWKEGQIFIERNGKIYTPAGLRVQ